MGYIYIHDIPLSSIIAAELPWPHLRRGFRCLRFGLAFGATGSKARDNFTTGMGRHRAIEICQKTGSRYVFFLCTYMYIYMIYMIYIIIYIR